MHPGRSPLLAALLLIASTLSAAAQSPAATPAPSPRSWPTSLAGYPIVGLAGLRAALKDAALNADRRIGAWPPAPPEPPGQEPRFVVARVAVSGEVRLEGLLLQSAKTFRMPELLKALQDGPLKEIRLKRITWAPIDDRTAQLFEIDARLKP